MPRMHVGDTRATATNCDEPSNRKRKHTTEVPASEKGSKRQKDGKRKMEKPQSASHVDADLGPRLCESCYYDIINQKKAAEVTDDSECTACELIRSSLPSNKLQESEDRIWTKLRVDPVHHSTKYYSKAVIETRDQDRKECGKLCIFTGDTDTSATIGEVIDFKTVASWLEHCEAVHGTGCLRLDSPIRLSKPIDVYMVDVSNNCITMKTTTTEYFALSYVWGNAITDTTTTTTHNLPSRTRSGSLKGVDFLPKTVSDAIELTRRVGVRYLWVDCLSIIQDSPKKHQDIHDMDIIFAQAALTIVAVSGVDADSGLPGVRLGTRRERITTVTNGRYTIKLSLPANKPALTRHTVYQSRGWTFQELLLSKRLLFLTEHQASFLCDASIRSEAVSKEAFKDTGIFGSGRITLRSDNSLSRSSITILESYTGMIQEYTLRRLSFEEDIENAFSGLALILNEWCGGSPVVHGMMSSFFGYSMQWTFRQDQNYFSSYKKEETGKKRAAFPSWSWVGWTAAVSNMCCSNPTYHLPLRSLLKNVVVTSYGTRDDSVSHSVLDQSAMVDDALSEEQLIRIDLKPAEFGLPSPIASTLKFDAERTEWINYDIKQMDPAGHILVFASNRKPSFCGFLSLVPASDISEGVRSQAARTVSEHDRTWSLVRTYGVQLTPWNGVNDDLQELLNEVEISEETKGFSAEKFRKRLQRYSLLSIVLVRPQGQYWERIGSGLMFEKDWPSTSKRAKIQAYQEEMVLI